MRWLTRPGCSVVGELLLSFLRSLGSPLGPFVSCADPAFACVCAWRFLSCAAVAFVFRVVCVVSFWRCCVGRCFVVARSRDRCCPGNILVEAPNPATGHGQQTQLHFGFKQRVTFRQAFQLWASLRVQPYGAARYGPSAKTTRRGADGTCCETASKSVM